MKKLKKLCGAVLIAGFMLPQIALESIDTAEAASGKWKQDKKGWYYSYSDGSYAKNQWVKTGKKWYYFDANGYMMKGWKKIGKKWYYFGTDGKMRSGWQKISGKWYYFNSGGDMATGWKAIAGTWYNFGTNGEMRIGWILSGDRIYYLDITGGMVTGNRKIDFFDYSFDSSGVMKEKYGNSLEDEQRIYVIISSMIQEIGSELNDYSENLKKNRNESEIRAFVKKNGFNLSIERIQEIITLCKKHNRFSKLEVLMNELLEMNKQLRIKYNSNSNYKTQSYLTDVANYLRKMADIYDEMADIAHYYSEK